MRVMEGGGEKEGKMAQATSHALCASTCACAEGLHFSAFHFVNGLLWYGLMVLLRQITISNTRNKKYKSIVHISIIFINANFHVSFSFGFRYNELLELITISNTRERVNENITTLCTYQR